jgi:signal transduction histidine kinase
LPQRPPKLLIAIFTVAILLVVAAIQALHTIDARRRTIAEAEQRTGNLAYVVASYVQDNFALADTSLRQLVVHARRVGGADAAAAEWDPILAAAKSALAGGGSISVVNADGIVTHSTQRAIVGQSRRDDFIFNALARADRDDLVVDMPFLTRVVTPPRYVLPLGRRLTDANGRFAGAVVASVIPSSFRDFFRTLDVGTQGVIWVFHPNGVVLFREPSTGDPINAPAADNAIYKAAIATTAGGRLEGPVEPGSPSYITAYTRTKTLPLIAAVSFSTAEVLAYWRHQVRSAIFALSALALTLAAMMIVLFRQIDARSKAEKDLVDVQRLESERLRETNERLAAALEGEQRAHRESEQANYLKDQFLMTVSHELRTPLTAIYGWAKVLTAGGLPADQRERAIEAVERNARVQARLIDDLLDVSRGISGKLRIDARPIAIADVLLAAAETLAPAIQAKRIAFRASVGDDVGMAMADPDRLQQIAWNLLSNAIKFTPDGGTVTLEASRTADTIEIVVSDSGAGISPEFLPHVFERFRQQDAGTRRRSGGLGLGLAIVRHLVELHGGTVAAESDGHDRGAVFRVRLPTRAAVAGTVQLATASPTVGE